MRHKMRAMNILTSDDEYRGSVSPDGLPLSVHVGAGDPLSTETDDACECGSRYVLWGHCRRCGVSR